MFASREGRWHKSRHKSHQLGAKFYQPYDPKVTLKRYETVSVKLTQSESAVCDTKPAHTVVCVFL